MSEIKYSQETNMESSYQHETGTVITSDGLWATVITNKSKSCRECGKAQAGICGKSGAGMVLRVRNPVRAAAGDTVLLELNRSTHIRAFFLAFGLPVAALFISAYAGYYISGLSGTAGLDVIFGISGLIVSIIYSLLKIRGLDRTSHLQIAKVLSDPPGSIMSPCAEETDYLAVFGQN